MVSALYPTEEMITAGIVSVAGRDDLPELTREEVTAIYMAMITALSQQWSEKMSAEQKNAFQIPHGKYWNEFYRKWMPDPEQKAKVKTK